VSHDGPADQKRSWKLPRYKGERLGPLVRRSGEGGGELVVGSDVGNVFGFLMTAFMTLGGAS
jgi:hypothetical protein